MQYQQKVPYSYLDNAPDPANPKSDDAFKKLLAGAKSLWCDVNSQNPLLAFPGPVGDLNRGVYESICKPEPYPLPPAPTPPYNGGQCEGVTYIVSGEYYSLNLSEPGPCQGQAPWWAEAPAPFQDPIVVSNAWRVPNGAGGQSVCHPGIYPSGANASIQNRELDTCGNIGGTGIGRNLVITSTQRKDGQPDTCGDPPLEYPPYTGPDINLTIDVDIAPPGSSSSNNIPIIYVPVSGELNINAYIDVGGIEFKFNIDGIEINFPPGQDGPAPQLPPSENPGQFLPIVPLPPEVEFPPIENCCSDVAAIKQTVDLTLTGEDYATRFDDLDTANSQQNTKLDTLLEDPVVDITVPVGTCNIDANGNPTYSETDTLFALLESEVCVFVASQLDRNQTTRNNCKSVTEEVIAVAAVPESDPAKIAVRPPILIQINRRVNTRDYHYIQIPHPSNIAPQESPVIPAYEAGKFRATLFCTDNSRFIVNAISPSVRDTVVQAAIAAIDPAFLEQPPNIRYTQLADGKIAEDLRNPVRLTYFPSGYRQGPFAWTRKLGEGF